jgi:predicted DNA-binding transcriptional regulator AlpA
MRDRQDSATVPAAGKSGMTREELLALPVTVDVLTAGRAFGLGRNTTYELIQAGEFPVKVHRYGKGSRRVLTSELWEALGVHPVDRVGSGV